MHIYIHMQTHTHNTCIHIIYPYTYIGHACCDALFIWTKIVSYVKDAKWIGPFNKLFNMWKVSTITYWSLFFKIIKKPPLKSMQAYHNTYNEPQLQHWNVDIEDSLSMRTHIKNLTNAGDPSMGEHTKSTKIEILQ